MADDYTRRVARVAAAQMAELAGFDATQESAIELLAELLIRYISEVSTAAHTYAADAHRSDFNVCDVLLALDDIGTPVGDLQKYLDAWLLEQARQGGREQGRQGRQCKWAESSSKGKRASGWGSRPRAGWWWWHEGEGAELGPGAWGRGWGKGGACVWVHMPCM